MKSNYKELGQFIRQVDVRNKDLKVDRLLGVSITKNFISSVANTIGTDLSKYKIIQKNQFACSLMQVSRDSKIPIAMFEEDICIVSPAYKVFEVVNNLELLPEYLSICFQRSEFDREASFIAVGGIRGSMPWSEFCRIKIAIPSIEEQEKIVSRYKVITDRMELLQKINRNLEQQAWLIYKKVVGNDNKDNLSNIADIIMGTSPSGDSLNASKKGVIFYQGKTDFGFRFPITTLRGRLT